jgi:hypothetical protein
VAAYMALEAQGEGGPVVFLPGYAEIPFTIISNSMITPQSKASADETAPPQPERGKT